MTDDQRKSGEKLQLALAYLLADYFRRKGIDLKSKKADAIFDSLARIVQSFPEKKDKNGDAELC